VAETEEMLETGWSKMDHDSSSPPASATEAASSKRMNDCPSLEEWKGIRKRFGAGWGSDASGDELALTGGDGGGAGPGLFRESMESVTLVLPYYIFGRFLLACRVKRVRVSVILLRIGRRIWGELF